MRQIRSLEALEKQPTGRDPDLNDGVRLNIRPIMSVPDVGRKGAGVLREKPNIKLVHGQGQRRGERAVVSPLWGRQDK